MATSTIKSINASATFTWDGVDHPLRMTGNILACELHVNGVQKTLVKDQWTEICNKPSNIPAFGFLSIPLVNGGIVTLRGIQGKISYISTVGGNVWLQGSGATVVV